MKQKTCKVCKEKFEPERPMQTTCSFEHAIEYVNNNKKKKQAQQSRERKKEFQETDKQFWKKKARYYLHKWIREVRDADKPCVSCGTKDAKWQAGHFHSDGGHSILRYHEWNIHKQCVYCNMYMSGNLRAYETELINRIGQEAFDSITNMKNDRKSWTLEELKDIAEKYQLLCKENKDQGVLL